MLRRALLKWTSAASVAAVITFPHLGLKAQDLAPQPLEPNERVQKVVLSPVLEELERWNLSRNEAGGILYDDAGQCGGFPVYSETTGRLLGYAPGKKRSGHAFKLKSRREILVAFGGIADEEI